MALSRAGLRVTAPKKVKVGPDPPDCFERRHFVHAALGTHHSPCGHGFGLWIIGGRTRGRGGPAFAQAEAEGGQGLSCRVPRPRCASRASRTVPAPSACARAPRGLAQRRHLQHTITFREGTSSTQYQRPPGGLAHVPDLPVGGQFRTSARCTPGDARDNHRRLTVGARPWATLRPSAVLSAELCGRLLSLSEVVANSGGVEARGADATGRDGRNAARLRWRRRDSRVPASDASAACCGVSSAAASAGAACTERLAACALIHPSVVRILCRLSTLHLRSPQEDTRAHVHGGLEGPRSSRSRLGGAPVAGRSCRRGLSSRAAPPGVPRAAPRW